MADAKTRKTQASVKTFLDAVPDERRRRDARVVDRLMRDISGEKPAMWGPNIVGYGSYSQRYANGSTADWPLVAFSPRKAALVLYLMPDFEGREALVKRLGKVTTGKSCVYVKSLDDVDSDVLRELVAASVAQLRRATQGG